MYTALSTPDEFKIEATLRAEAQKLGGKQGYMKFYTLRAVTYYLNALKNMSKEQRAAEKELFERWRAGDVDFNQISAMTARAAAVANTASSK